MPGLSVKPHIGRVAVLLAAGAVLNGCSSIDRVFNIGEQPALSAIDNPTAKPGYKPVQMPMPTPHPATYNPNSLWRNGSRPLFSRQSSPPGLPTVPLINQTVPAQLLNANGASNSDGKGQIQRTDAVTTNVAAVVT